MGATCQLTSPGEFLVTDVLQEQGGRGGQFLADELSVTLAF